MNSRIPQPQVLPLNSPPAGQRLASAYLAQLSERVDQIVQATLAGDWAEVQRLAQSMGSAAAPAVQAALGDCASSICAAIDKEDFAQVKRAVLRLIGAAGRLSIARRAS